MDVNDKEDDRRTHRVDMTEQPSVGDFLHDRVVDAVECQVDIRFVIHQQKDPRHQQEREQYGQQYPHRPQKVDIFGNPILGHHHFCKVDDTQTLVKPLEHRVCFFKFCHTSPLTLLPSSLCIQGLLHPVQALRRQV